MTNPNLYAADFDEPRETIDGFTAYPHHFHLAEEEVLVLLEGDLAPRTPSGWERVRRGDVVRFAVGIERPEVGDVEPA